MLRRVARAFERPATATAGYIAVAPHQSGSSTTRSWLRDRSSRPHQPRCISVAQEAPILATKRGTPSGFRRLGRTLAASPLDDLEGPACDGASRRPRGARPAYRLCEWWQPGVVSHIKADRFIGTPQEKWAYARCLPSSGACPAHSDPPSATPTERGPIRWAIGRRSAVFADSAGRAARARASWR